MCLGVSRPAHPRPDRGMTEVVAWRYRKRGTTEEWQYTANVFHMESIQRQTREVWVEGHPETVPSYEVEGLVRAEALTREQAPHHKAWGGC